MKELNGILSIKTLKIALLDFVWKILKQGVLQPVSFNISSYMLLLKEQHVVDGTCGSDLHVSLIQCSFSFQVERILMNLP